MSTASPLSPIPSPVSEMYTLRQHWVWFLVLGVALVVLGSIAIGWASLATITIAATWLFGFVLLGGGLGEIVHSFTIGRWSGMLVHLLIGLLYAVVGFMMISDPAESAITLTKIIAIFMIVGGIFRVVAALSYRFPGWEWVLLNGGITLLLGLFIYKNWPGSGLWFIGLALGVDMIMNGWSWIALAIGMKRLPEPTT
ncbi:MAG: DUF308 domain-containing protein [Planctomycetaceae bacterium]|nr:DUF308 domain-containing protein [Planctomycetaceae bacterium]